MKIASYQLPGSRLNIKPYFPGMGIPMLKIRRSRDRLIFNMRIPILVRRHYYIATVPWYSLVFPRAYNHVLSHILWTALTAPPHPPPPPPPPTPPPPPNPHPTRTTNTHFIFVYICIALYIIQYIYGHVIITATGYPDFNTDNCS